MSDDKNIEKRDKRGCWVKGQSGNPNGHASEATELARQVMSANYPQLLKIGLDKALDGDSDLLKFFLNKLLPKKIAKQVDLDLASKTYLEQIRTVLLGLDKSHIDDEYATILIDLISKSAKVDEVHVVRDYASQLEERIVELETQLKK